MISFVGSEVFLIFISTQSIKYEESVTGEVGVGHSRAQEVRGTNKAQIFHDLFYVNWKGEILVLHVIIIRS